MVGAGDGRLLPCPEYRPFRRPKALSAAGQFGCKINLNRSDSLRHVARPRLADELANRALSHRGVMEAPSRWTRGLAWFLDGREIMHLHGPNAADVRLTREVIRRRWQPLASDPWVDPRAHGSDWIRVRFRRRSDLDLVVGLFEDAVSANARPGHRARGRPV
jgi:hypothetical protein